MKIGNRKIFYGWVVVLSAFITMLTVSIPIYSFGVFVSPLTETFGWSRANISGASAILLLLVGFGGMFSGRISDKYGVKRVMQSGLIIYSGSLLLTSRVSSLLSLYACFAGMGIGVSSFYAPLTSTISRWFDKRRGLAVGIALTAFGLGMAVFSPLLEVAISAFGWRLAFFYSGILSLVLLSVSTYLMKSPPQEVGQKEKVDYYPNSDGGKPSDFTFKETMSSPAYWMVYCMLLLANISAFFITVHIVPYAIDIGIPSFYAATLLTAIGFINIGGRIAGGIMADRIGSSKSLIILFLLQAMSIFLVPHLTELYVLYLIALLFGFAYGGWALIPSVISSEFFGTAHLGLITGTLETVAGIGGAFGPYFAGYIFDLTGGYELAFIVGGAATAGAALLAGLLTFFFGAERVNPP